LENFLNFWWVNHKQTHKEEIDGGYVWSPKTNRNGARNETYLNLTRTAINDAVFSYAHKNIMAIGRVIGPWREAARPSEFGSVGAQWDHEGWLVPIEWVPLEHPYSPRAFLSRIVNLLPEKYSPIQSDGRGKQAIYLTKISEALGNELLSICELTRNSTIESLQQLSVTIEEEAEEQRIADKAIPPTEKQQLIKARRGQGIFRIRVGQVEQRCRLTRLEDKSLLIASHIKPWRKSTDDEKLDENNGLLLSPHVDKLFDSGLISFADDGRILCANEAIRKVMRRWGLDPEGNVGEFSTAQRKYLLFHRQYVFKRSASLAELEN
jgi:putative restriction endonuclease